VNKGYASDDGRSKTSRIRSLNIGIVSPPFAPLPFTPAAPPPATPESRDSNAWARVERTCGGGGGAPPGKKKRGIEAAAVAAGAATAERLRSGERG